MTQFHHSKTASLGMQGQDSSGHNQNHLFTCLQIPGKPSAGKVKESIGQPGR